MKVYYSNEKIKKGQKSIFLAGTTASNRKKDWRKKVVQLLIEKGYDGVVYNPDYTDLEVRCPYEEQLKWELRGIQQCTAILFWVDRDLPKRPGLTTNVEFGYWLHSGRLIYGRPDSAEKVLYLDMLYKLQTGLKPCTTLEELVDKILAFIND